MAVYDELGNELSAVYDELGNSLNEVYDELGNVIFTSGETPVDRTKRAYDFYADPDPNKGYTWTYTLSDLKMMQNGNFTIGIQTDTHRSTEGLSCGTPLKNMTKQLYFDFICNLGDVPRGYSSDSAETTQATITEMMSRYTDYVESPVLIAMGNHDNACMASGYISKADMYANYIGNNLTLTDIVNPTGELYYYKDFVECRVIMLDTADYPYQAKSSSDINVSHATISENQLNWFANVALNTDKPVLILSHHPLVTDLSPSYLVEPTGDTADEHMIPYRATQLISVLQTFRNNGGDVVACLNGHMHAQEDAYVDGINYIGFTNGGTFAELVFIDFKNRIISTKVINSSSISDREFEF